ncbi:glycine betaine transport system permease protein OpuAB [bacterium MnTg02]|nr:glycine betaine transport system permease protein OpuAB [bacterium MnTg02]
MFPETLRLHFGDELNDGLEWLIQNYGDSFEAFSNGVLTLLVALEKILRGAPWWLVIIITSLLAYHASRRLFLSALVAAMLFLIGLFGLWDLAMQTLAIMIVSILTAVLIGIPIGLTMSQSKRTRAVLLPLLDIMQTMPSFVYLIPALMLFGLGKVPAIMATVIYSIPPLIRLTDLGIRQVNPEIVEASRAFGANRMQRLTGVEIPLAIPNIMQGINQTTMMALAMVVIASMIGARGLGEQVLLGIQRLDVGQGAEAGIAIVALAVVFDRITQAYGEAVQYDRNTGR